MASQEQINDAFAKALDHVQARITPNDGGVVAAAIEALRELSLHQDFSEKFNTVMKQKLDAQPKPVEAASAPAATPQTSAGEKDGDK